jgi:antitoxin component of RelBE/YafQ-DinJ toxin-antitoxin module
MSIEKQLKQGRRTALRYEKEPVLITFQINKRIRTEAIEKCDKMGINLSSYLRICVEKLIELPIDYHIEEMYKQVIQAATDEVTPISKPKKRK